MNQMMVLCSAICLKRVSIRSSLWMLIPKVNHQRFCQQCSRFHEISEFDDAKRSCRERLAGHNERRRKAIADLQSKEEGVDITSVSDVIDKSWRVRGHLEHLTTRVQGKPSY